MDWVDAMHQGQHQRRWNFGCDRVGFAVGDIHGRSDLLVRLFDQLEEVAERESLADPIVFFLGDYVDRGPDSAGVLELMASGRPHGFERRCLKGNHDQAMQNFLANPTRTSGWLHYGGLDTLISFQVRPPSLGASETVLEDTAKALRDALNARQMAFLEGLENMVVHGDYVFAHAGVDPERSLDEQNEFDLCSIRERFLESELPFSHCVVHGHTPRSAPYRDAWRIGVDTGAYYSNVLSGVRLEREDATFFSILASRAR